MPITSNMAAGRKKKRTIWGAVLFAVYLIVLLYFLLFAEGFGRGHVEEYRYNLVPFKEIKRYWFWMLREYSAWPYFFANVVGNVAGFIPFGFFPQMFRLKKNKIGGMVIGTTVAGAIFSLMIETCQLLLMIGSFDVDDILLNTVGAFIGALIYAVGFLMRNPRRKRR